MFIVGDRLGDYEVLAPLSSGGMADVFVARQHGAGGFERLAALKVVHKKLLADPVFTRMLKDEAILTAQIRHPNVVRVERLFEHEGSYVIAMELVLGASLAVILDVVATRQRRMGVTLAAFIAAETAAALHAAHETTDKNGRALGVVHRDVSPGNILLSIEGYVKVIDFGVARARGRLEATRSGDLRGKLGYMAPEQAIPGGVSDLRADLYALGIVLWESLSSSRYLRGSGEMQQLAAVRSPTWREPPDSVPPALRVLLRESLDPLRENRPPNAREFRKRLLAAVPEAVTIDHEDVRGFVRELVGNELAATWSRVPGVESDSMRPATTDFFSSLTVP